ncbi:MAG: phosphatase PAP2 family protein [Rhodoferax sp.]|nr:phosphatase PAP2 family protein [Rhodoferax sp.]MCB2003753.1 phosphatase PAP2 family protein [Rhodoferax sp.]MCP5263545.1 phosphatase PAP2 family protein [Rhodoferax sp.]
MFELDSAIFLWINASASSAAWVLTLARFASETLPQWLVAACAGALLAAGPRVRIAVVRVLLAMVLAWLCARGIKALLPMPRPFMLGLGTAWLPHAGSAGFPSSHASVAFAFAVAVAMQTPRRIGAWAALAMATLIAWSRISLGLHFPFDVAAGAVLGTVCGWAVVRLVMPRADPSLQPTPAAPHP